MNCEFARTKRVQTCTWMDLGREKMEPGDVHLSSSSVGLLEPGLVIPVDCRILRPSHKVLWIMVTIMTTRVPVERHDICRNPVAPQCSLRSFFFFFQVFSPQKSSETRLLRESIQESFDKISHKINVLSILQRDMANMHDTNPIYRWFTLMIVSPFSLHCIQARETPIFALKLLQF